MKRRTLNERNWFARYLKTGIATQATKDAGYSAKTDSVKGCQLRRKFASEIAQQVAANFRDKCPRMAKIIEELVSTQLGCDPSDRVPGHHAARDRFAFGKRER